MGLGDPGVLGEWIWFSNKYKPPVAELLDLSLNAATKGVGMEGSAGKRVDEPPIPYWLLSGVPGEISETSSVLETDRFRDLMLFKLEEEKFFLRPGRVTDGDPDRGSSSCPKAVGKGGVFVSSRTVPGMGEGVGLAERGLVVRLGPADRAWRCWTM
jgi:hypothetical protein